MACSAAAFGPADYRIWTVRHWKRGAPGAQTGSLGLSYGQQSALVHRNQSLGVPKW